MSAQQGRGSQKGGTQGHVAPVASVGRVPPSDLAAEGAVLSGCLQANNEAFEQVADLLKPEHFYSESNRRIYEAIIAVVSRSQPLDIIAVKHELEARERLAQVGGPKYLAEICDLIPAVSNIRSYAEMVVERWRVRTAIATCQAFAAEGYSDIGETQEWIDKLEQSVYDIARPPEASGGVVPLKGVVQEVFTLVKELAQRGASIVGLATGYGRLDEKLSGLHKGEFTIIAARPGMGKTSIVLNMAVNIAQPRRDPAYPDDPDALVLGDGVAIFSLEMPKEQLAMRLMCCFASVDLGRLRSGGLLDRDWTNLTEAASKLHHMPIFIDDTPSPTVLDVRAKVRRLQADQKKKGAPPIKLVVIDYLQLMQPATKSDNRENDVAEISRGTKRLAKDLKLPVVSLSQLNRAVETRGTKDRRPQLSDLRESGSLEQDADNIIFIYRDDYYHKDSTEKGIAELLVAKQRNGPTGCVKVRWNASYARFDNLADGEYEEKDDASA